MSVLPSDPLILGHFARFLSVEANGDVHLRVPLRFPGHDFADLLPPQRTPLISTTHRSWRWRAPQWAGELYAFGLTGWDNTPGFHPLLATDRRFWAGLLSAHLRRGIYSNPIRLRAIPSIVSQFHDFVQQIVPSFHPIRPTNTLIVQGTSLTALRTSLSKVL